MATKAQLTHTLRTLQVAMTSYEWNADTADYVQSLLTAGGFPPIELPANYQIRIEQDFDYVPDGDYDVAKEARELAAGELGAYRVLLQKECECGNWNTVQSVHGVVVSGSDHDQEYGTVEGIEDDYLRNVACDLMIEEGLA
jgi:hypothetical protein